MATFDQIMQKGNVTITKDGDEYRFEFEQYDSDTGELRPEKLIRRIRKSDLQTEKAMLVEQMDEQTARYNAEISEIDAKLAVINSM